MNGCALGADESRVTSPQPSPFFFLVVHDSTHSAAAGSRQGRQTDASADTKLLCRMLWSLR